jgi:hypothetical protein
MKKENITRGTKETRKFLAENLSKEPYLLLKLHVKEWFPKIEIDFDKVPDSLFEKAERDLAFFEVAEKNREKIKRMSVGDYIRDENGKLTMVGIFLSEGRFQDTEGGSFHINEGGTGSFSGGFTGNIFDGSDFVFSGEYQPLNCWIFSEFWPGANRGVHSTIMVKVWNKKIKQL